MLPFRVRTHLPHGLAHGVTYLTPRPHLHAVHPVSGQQRLRVLLTGHWARCTPAAMCLFNHSLKCTWRRHLRVSVKELCAVHSAGTAARGRASVSPVPAPAANAAQLASALGADRRTARCQPATLARQKRQQPEQHWFSKLRRRTQTTHTTNTRTNGAICDDNAHMRRHIVYNRFCRLCNTRHPRPIYFSTAARHHGTAAWSAAIAAAATGHCPEATSRQRRHRSSSCSRRSAPDNVCGHGCCGHRQRRRPPRWPGGWQRRYCCLHPHAPGWHASAAVRSV